MAQPLHTDSEIMPHLFRPSLRPRSTSRRRGQGQLQGGGAEGSSHDRYFKWAHFDLSPPVLIFLSCNFDWSFFVLTKKLINLITLLSPL
jgi:hypothetical protein